MVPSYVLNRLGFYTLTNSSGQSFLESRGSCRYTSLSRGALIRGSDHSTPHPWSYTVDNHDAVEGVMLYRNLPSGSLIRKEDGFISQDFPPLPPPVSSNLYNRALSNLNDKVRGGIDLSIDLAQAGQTVKMFNVIDQFESLFGKRWNHTFRFSKDATRLLRDAGSEFLKYRYGWSPLIQTIYDCADQNQRTVRNLLKNFRAHAVEGIVDYPWTRTYFLGSQAVNRIETVKAKGKDLVEIGLELRVRASDFNIDQWTSLNPVSIAWELVPYSFVFDWFFDVGSYLRNLETALLSRNDFVTGYVSTLRACDSTFSGTRRISNTSSEAIYSNQKSSRHYVSFERKVLSSYPLPRKPTFAADLGSGRLLNAAGLLTQFLGRGR